MVEPKFEDYSDENTPEKEYEGFVTSMGGSLSEVREVFHAVVNLPARLSKGNGIIEEIGEETGEE